MSDKERTFRDPILGRSLAEEAVGGPEVGAVADAMLLGADPRPCVLPACPPVGEVTVVSGHWIGVTTEVEPLQLGSVPIPPIEENPHAPLFRVDVRSVSMTSPWGEEAVWASVSAEVADAVFRLLGPPDLPFVVNEERE